jgi:hypothetical protein
MASNPFTSNVASSFIDLINATMQTLLDANLLIWKVKMEPFLNK